MNNITSLIFNNSKKTLSWQVYRMEDIIKQRGRYYLLNLCNDAILAIMYNGIIHIFFQDYQLRMNSCFLWHQFDQKVLIDVKEKEALEKLYHLYNKKIYDVTMDKFGDISLKFEDGTELDINEECRGQIEHNSENWHLFYKDKLVAYDRLEETVIVY